jgi:purine-binding chemotaxis protein CheW
METMTNTNQGKIMQLATFRLSGRLLGVDILDVKEVCDNITITPVHHASENVCGYMNIRGQIILVIDLRTEFHFEPGVIDSSSKVLVFKEIVDEPFGILVDSVGDVVEISENTITDRRASDTAESVPTEVQDKRKTGNDICLGVSPLEKEMVLILNSRAVLN